MPPESQNQPRWCRPAQVFRHTLGGWPLPILQRTAVSGLTFWFPGGCVAPPQRGRATPSPRCRCGATGGWGMRRRICLQRTAMQAAAIAALKELDSSTTVTHNDSFACSWNSKGINHPLNCQKRTLFSSPPHHISLSVSQYIDFYVDREIPTWPSRWLQHKWSEEKLK